MRICTLMLLLPVACRRCSTAGVVGAMAGVVGAAMAMEAVKLLTGVGEPLMGEVGLYSAFKRKVGI